MLDLCCGCVAELHVFGISMIKFTVCVILAVDDSPELRYLSRYVIPGVSSMWYKLGLELFDDKDIPLLDNIKANHPDSCETCCMKMFRKWRDKTPEGSWKKLLDALKHIDQNKLAKQLSDGLQYTGE